MIRAWRVALVLVLVSVALGSDAKNGAFRSTKHGDPVKGPKRKADQSAGSCVQCHDGHLSHQRGGGGNAGLFGSNGSELCLSCHAMAPIDGGAFPGAAEWSSGSHARERLTRSGEPLARGDNPCAACHDPHGVRDAGGVIPALLAQRETALCLACHDGTRGADIRAESQKTWTHGQNARGAHDPAEARGAAPANSSPMNRHVTCSDCHNPHLTAADVVVRNDGEASSRLAGVSRVQVIHGAAGTQPSYRWLAANDPSQAYEYEICFKCHSSATKQMPQAEDIARTTNPANPSFHPIQAAGRNQRIDERAFVDGYNAESRVRCADCHASDSPRVRGPHGSSFEKGLRRRHVEGTGAPMSRNDLCFACHAWEVYGASGSDQTLLAASRFNAPSEPGHAFHVGGQKIACAVCHEAHGSTRYPSLIAVRKRPGIVSYTQTPNGGTCTTTCHATRSYRVNYSR